MQSVQKSEKDQNGPTTTGLNKGRAFNAGGLFFYLRGVKNLWVL